MAYMSSCHMPLPRLQLFFPYAIPRYNIWGSTVNSYWSSMCMHVGVGAVVNCSGRECGCDQPLHGCPRHMPWLGRLLRPWGIMSNFQTWVVHCNWMQNSCQTDYPKCLLRQHYESAAAAGHQGFCTSNRGLSRNICTLAIGYQLHELKAAIRAASWLLLGWHNMEILPRVARYSQKDSLTKKIFFPSSTNALLGTIISCDMLRMAFPFGENALP